MKMITDSFIKRNRGPNKSAPVVLPFLVSIPLSCIVYLVSRTYCSFLTHTLTPLILPYILSTRGIIATFSLQDSYHNHSFSTCILRFFFIVLCYLLIFTIILVVYDLYSWSFRILKLILTLGCLQVSAWFAFKVFEKFLVWLPKPLQYPLSVFFYLGINDVGVFLYLGNIDIIQEGSQNYFLVIILILSLLLTITLFLKFFIHKLRDSRSQIIVLLSGFAFNFLQGLQLFQSDGNSTEDIEIIPLTTLLMNIGGNICNSFGCFFYELSKYPLRGNSFRPLLIILPWVVLIPLFLLLILHTPGIYYFVYLGITVLTNLVFLCTASLIYLVLSLRYSLTIILCILAAFRDLWDTLSIPIYLQL